MRRYEGQVSCPSTKNMNTALITEHPEAIALLSSMYLCKPSREVIENWQIALAEDRSGLLDDLKKAIAKTDVSSKKELEELLWDYTRLFIGPYKLPCPPWESVYTSPKRLMMQEAADQVDRLYKEAGLTISTDDVMPDHIGAELNFLAVMLQKVLSQTEKDFYMGIAGRFLDEHLLQWLPNFTKDLEDAAETPLYKALARTTRNVIGFAGK